MQEKQQFCTNYITKVPAVTLPPPSQQLVGGIYMYIYAVMCLYMPICVYDMCLSSYTTYNVVPCIYTMRPYYVSIYILLVYMHCRKGRVGRQVGESGCGWVGVIVVCMGGSW
jgi:hypothetical protein